MKLSKRLEHIESMVTSGYDHIWDSCCDHGLLGAALLARQAAPTIHFVDLVPELMQKLAAKLVKFFPKSATTSSAWQVHCMDVSKLPLLKFSRKHLVIIAGVGGDLMTEFVTAIYQKNPTAEIDFLLCPVHHHFTLRQQLINLNFSLKTEALVLENKRYYEILWVSTISNLSAAINPAGSLIWQAQTIEQSKIAADYLRNTLAHYRRMQLRHDVDVQHIIDAYSTVSINLLA